MPPEIDYNPFENEEFINPYSNNKTIKNKKKDCCLSCLVL